MTMTFAVGRGAERVLSAFGAGRRTTRMVEMGSREPACARIGAYGSHEEPEGDHKSDA
jgi:hypothetical protein